MTESDKSRREYYRTRGRCVQCGKRDSRTESGSPICGKCADIIAASRKRLYYRRKAEGVCVFCGKSDSRTESGRVLCIPCNEHAVEAERQKRLAGK